MPQGRPEDYQTFQVSTPRDGAILTACKDAGCRHWREGWKSKINEHTPLGRLQAHWIRYGPREERRTFREQKAADGDTVFIFEAHQRCFQEHYTRPEIYVVRGGDWRGNPTGAFRQHANAADWVEHFAENQQKLADQAQQGMY